MRRGWSKRKTSDETFGIGKGPWRLHAPVARTLPPRRGPAHHPGAFPWREPSRASGRTASRALGSGACTHRGRAKTFTAFWGSLSKIFSAVLRHSALFFVRGQGSGRHWTRARHGRWTTWTGSRILPRNPMSPRISAICTRTSEVRFARETAAVLGQRPASACAFRERRVRLAKRRKGIARSRRDAAARRASTFAESRRDRHRLSSRSREPLTRAPARSLPASPSPEKSPSDRPQCRATRPKMTSRRRTARWRKSRTPISTPLPCSERQPLGLSTR